MSTLPAHWPLTSFQRSTLPVVGLCQTRSLAPSPLRSPMPAGFQPKGCGPTSTPPTHWPLVFFHTSPLPVPALYQTTSLVPSPLRSRTPANDQLAGGVGLTGIAGALRSTVVSANFACSIEKSVSVPSGPVTATLSPRF